MNKPTIQVVKLVLSNGEVCHYTGTKQIKDGESPDVAHFQIFNIEEPMNMVAEALSVCRNTLQTIDRTKLTDEQRKEMLAKAIERLDNAD